MHLDNYPEGAAEYFAEWLTKGLYETPETFCALSEGNMEQDEYSHPDIEWRYRVMWPQLNPNMGFAESQAPPNHLVVVLVQARDVETDIWTTEFCGPMFLFLERYLERPEADQIIEQICSEMPPPSH